MGALSTCSKLLLIICNIFFMVLGLTFFVCGLIIRFGSSLINGYTDSVIKSIEDSIAEAGMGTVTLDFDLSDILFGLAIGFICFGLFLLIVSILGCCGACCNVRVMIIAYLVICIVILVGQIVVIGILYGSPDTFHDPAKERLHDGIQSDYMGLNGTNLNSVGWNVVMQKMGCCGVDDFDDFTGATNWVSDYSTSSATAILKTPLACCRTLPSSSTDYTCAAIGTATDSNNYQSEGCYENVWDKTLGNTTIMIAVLVSLGVFQLLLIVCAVVVCLGSRKNKTSPK